MKRSDLLAAASTAALVFAGAAPASAQTLPEEIPLFPLPNVALFPGGELPLHIFEPRYRAMVTDALEGDRVIGMVMLRPGFEDDYEGNPPVYDVGGAGIIESVDELSDGRYNLVLRGLSRFRIVSEDTTGAVRVAGVEALPERLGDPDRARLRAVRSLLQDALRTAAPSIRIPSDLSDEQYVNAVSQLLAIEAAERQELVEMDGPLERARALLERIGATRQVEVSPYFFGRLRRSPR